MSPLICVLLDGKFVEPMEHSTTCPAFPPISVIQFSKDDSLSEAATVPTKMPHNVPPVILDILALLRDIALSLRAVGMDAPLLDPAKADFSHPTPTLSSEPIRVVPPSPLPESTVEFCAAPLVHQTAL